MAQKIIDGQTYDIVVAVKSDGSDISGSESDTTGGVTEATLVEVRDRLPSALVGDRLKVDVASLTVSVDNAQLEIANEVGNPVPVSGTVEIANDSGSPIPVSGTVTADTELPAAIALSDALTNPTAPGVGAYNLVWDSVSSQWLRLKAGLNGTLTAIAGVLNVFPLGRYNLSTITLNDGEYRGLQLDTNANLKVNPGYLVLNLSRSVAPEDSRVVKISSGDLFRVKGYSTAAGFIQAHNAIAKPSSTVVPIISFAIAANANFEEDYGALPYNFNTGIVLVFSSTQATYTPSTASVWFEVGYL